MDCYVVDGNTTAGSLSRHTDNESSLFASSDHPTRGLTKLKASESRANFGPPNFQESP